MHLKVYIRDLIIFSAQSFKRPEKMANPFDIFYPIIYQWIIK